MQPRVKFGRLQKPLPSARLPPTNEVILPKMVIKRSDPIENLLESRVDMIIVVFSCKGLQRAYSGTQFCKSILVFGGFVIDRLNQIGKEASILA